MSTVEISGSTRKRKQRTRNGEASVITEELLTAVLDGVKGLENPAEDIFVLESHPRATPGSAAGMGYQIKDKLLAAPYSVKVHSSPVPVDEEAWDEFTKGLSQAEVADKVKAAKNGTDADAKAAIQHYPAFYPFK